MRKLAAGTTRILKIPAEPRPDWERADTHGIMTWPRTYGTGMSETSSFREVMTGLRAGDTAAAKALFNRFASQLIQVARVRLGARLRPKVDPEDVVQSVFRSFFVRQADGQYVLQNWDSLWGLLIRMTLRKCDRWTERFSAARRDVAAEVSAADGGSDRLWEKMAPDASAADAAALAELVESLLDKLEGVDREMLALRLEGHSIPEISVLVRRSERSVDRVLSRVRKHLERIRQADEEAEQK